MNWKYLLMLAIASTLTVSCTREVSSNPIDTPASTTTIASSPSAESGSFQPGEHPTKGKVTVVTQQGKQYLEFDDNFKTDNGPDLFVILHRAEAPPISGIKEKDYVSIARLQKTSGNQRYPLPNNINIAEFKSVAIWCRKFNATFGYATL